MSDAVNILIVDDELPSLYSLKDYVSELMPEANVLAFDNHLDAFDSASQNLISIAFLDVEMPGIDGVELGRRLKNINPKINIIFATAFDKYAFDASKLFNSGYLLKPFTREGVKEQLDNLRYPLTSEERKLKINCFGLFEVYHNGSPVQFERQKSKEMLAYLVDRQGARVTIGELSSALYEGCDDEQKNRHNLYSAWFSLKKSLKSIDFEDVLIHSQNAYAVDTKLIDCDYYRYLDKEDVAIHSYRGLYMHQYSWAEFSFKSIL